MDFFKYNQEVTARIAERLAVLNTKYWYVPNRIKVSIFKTGYEMGVDEANNLTVKMAELYQNGTSIDELATDLDFFNITKSM